MQNKKQFEIILHVGRVTSLQSLVAKTSCHSKTLTNECSEFLTTLLTAFFRSFGNPKGPPFYQMFSR